MADEVSPSTSINRIAVVTDVLSPAFTFPIWRDYYGAQFGHDNLFLVTYNETQGSFERIPPDNILPSARPYNDDARPVIIADLVQKLLSQYDVIVRVDVDEMLLVDPIRDGSLAEYISSCPSEHITALGFDLIQGPNDDPLDIARPVLEQRSLGFALTAMNKTCVTRTPLRWGRGFHYCTAAPKLDRLYLFHLKRVDIARQTAWAHSLSKRLAADTFESKYYSEDIRIAENFVKSRWNYPAVTGDDALRREDFNRQFSQSIRLTPSTGIFDGPYDIEKTNVVIPERFRSLF